MKELKLAWRYVRRHWWQYILGILALFIVDEVNTYVPRFTGEITNGLDQHTLDMGGVMGLVWKIVLIGADSHHLRRLLLRQGDAQALSGQAAGVLDADGPSAGNGIGHPRD